jgi:DNA-binding CsgD family transcriptional regulator/tetratricopeptide (TPR) repeat protein
VTESPYDPAVELVEREPYLAALAEHLAAAAAGEGRLVLVAGEAGIGKTTLLRTFAEEHSAKTRIAWGACDGLFTPEPLAPLHDLAGQLDGGLAEAIAADAPRRDLFAAALDALGQKPTVAIFEDVHWADEATLDLLRFLGRRLERTSTLVVATYRDDEVGAQHPLRAVLGDVETKRRIALPPLSEEGVRSLARGSDLDAGDLHRQTGGNPFFVTEVLAAGGTGVPSSVRDAVLARASRLEVAAREVLDAAAVIGMTAELGSLEQVLGESPRGLDECLAAGVLQSVGGGVGFRHELARRVVEEAIDPLRRTELHGRVLAALEQSGAVDEARLAHHAEAAGDAEAVLRHARSAAVKATEAGSHREAAEQYARALRFSGALSSTEIAELLERRSDECAVTLQPEEALVAGEAALERYRELGDRLKEGELLSKVSRLLYNTARMEDASDAAREAVGLLEELPPGRELALAYANMAHQRALRLDDQATLLWGDRAFQLAENLGERKIVASVLTTMGIAEATAGRGTARLEAALELAREHGSDDQVARIYGGLVFAAVRHRDWPAADRWLQEGLEYSTERDLDDSRTYLLAWRAIAALERGRWDEAAADARAALSHPHAVLLRAWSLLTLGILRARRGDPDVWGPLDEALGLVRENPPQRHVPVQITRAEAAFLEGDDRRARAELGTLPPVGLTDRWIAGELAVWRRRLGGRPEETGPVPEPFALELAGDYAGAGTAWEKLESPYNAALVLAGSDDEHDLRRSHEALLALGARPGAAIVARRLRELGARGLARGPRPATREHPAGLTRRELEVLDLVAEGLTNGEIAARLVISEKTVGHHVSSILGKLGVGSRYEAAKLAAQDRELAGPR